MRCPVISGCTAWSRRLNGRGVRTGQRWNMRSFSMVPSASLIRPITSSIV